MPTLLVFGARNLGRVLTRELAADGWRMWTHELQLTPALETWVP